MEDVEDQLRLRNQPSSSGYAKDIDHLNLMPLLADADGQPNIDKAMGNIEKQLRT